MPRHTLDRWVYKINTMDVCLTKHKENDIYTHMVKMHKKAEELFEKYDGKYRAILKEFNDEQTHIYARYNWRQGEPSRFWKKNAESWYLTDIGDDEREFVAIEYFSLFHIYADFMVCDKYINEWNEEKPDWNTMVHEVTTFHNTLKDVADSIKLYEEMDFVKYKALWVAKDKEWIDEQAYKKEHSKTHPVIERPSPTNLDVEPQPYPSQPLRDDCIYCKQHWEEMKPKYELSVQVWSKNKQEQIEWETEQKLESQKSKQTREQRAKAYEQWLVKQDPINLHCDHCEYEANDDDEFDEHMKSEEHKKKSRFCKVCNLQCRNDADYAYHIETTKHKKNAGLIEKVKIYKCNHCDYQTTVKCNFEKHIVAKNHKDD